MVTSIKGCLPQSAMIKTSAGSSDTTESALDLDKSAKMLSLVRAVPFVLLTVKDIVLSSLSWHGRKQLKF